MTTCAPHGIPDCTALDVCRQERYRRSITERPPLQPGPYEVDPLSHRVDSGPHDLGAVRDDVA